MDYTLTDENYKDKLYIQCTRSISSIVVCVRMYIF